MENKKEEAELPTAAAAAQPTDEAVVGVDGADVEEEDYILIDDVTGDRVEPNAETSLLMAIAIDNEMMAAAAAEEKEDNNTNDMGSPQITVVDEHDALYIEGMKNMGAFFAATQSFDFCVSSSDDEGEGDGAEPKDVVEGAKESVGTKIDGTDKVIVEKDGADDNDDEAEEEDEGMEQYGSRYESDIGYDGEWTLEKILQRRRVNKKTLQQQQRQRQMDGDDYCDDVTQVGGSGRAQQSGMEYLCRWRWYSEPTWESREWLEDLGYKKEADSFDADIAARGQHLRTKVIRKKQPTPAFQFENYFPDLMKNICERLSSTNRHLVRYASCLAPQVERRFMKQWMLRQKQSCPVLVFHGTRTHCVKGIARNGLLVPGTNGIRVLNGQAYGRGIYTSPYLGTPLGYTDRAGFIFVCAGLYGPGIASFRANGDNILIFPDDNLVLPFMIIQTAHGRTSDLLPWENVEPTSLGEILESIDAPDPHGPWNWTGAGALPPYRNASGTSVSKHAANDALRQEPGGYTVKGKGMSKKMVKKAPRYVKDFYQRGLLRNKK